MIMKKIYFLIINILFSVCCYGAYLRNVPITLTQPDGAVINCFATGDEYYNWLHDSLDYTIIQSPTTGYYHYAILDNDSLVCSSYIVGTVSPTSVNLLPHINISSEKIGKIIERNPMYQENMRSAAERKASGNQTRGNTGTINNIVIFIRLAGENEFPADSSPPTHTQKFNGLSDYPWSMRSYFREVSYNKLDIISHFFPYYDGINILSYQDTHNIDYYRPFNAVTNPDGYKPEELYERKQTLLYNALNSVKSQIELALSTSQLDYDNDDLVDNVCFVLKHSVYELPWGELLHPHKGGMDTTLISINNKKVRNYNLVGCWPNTAVICHEMNHTLGAPDLYHYDEDDRDMHPVGKWDLMGHNLKPHMGAYMKYQYGKWIGSIPVITTPGTYTLQPLTSPVNNCYKIFIEGVPHSQYIVLEYRKKYNNGEFEFYVPGSGLIIYRINENFTGNASGIGSGGVADEVYIFRPDGKIYPANSKGDIDNAHFSETTGRTEFGNYTNPYCFMPDNSYGNIYIRNIRENANGTLSFDFLPYCNGNNITFSNTSNLPAYTDAARIQTTGSVIVKSTDNVTFEAGEVILNEGFEVQSGGTFEVIIKKCEPY